MKRIDLMKDLGSGFGEEEDPDFPRCEESAHVLDGYTLTKQHGQAVWAGARALEAVLELHRENTPEDGSCRGYSDTGYYGFLDSWCVECSGQSDREYGTDWPCPTVAAITSALKIEEQP